MIAAQARELSELLRENSQLEMAQNDTKAIAATQTALTMAAATAATLSEVAITAVSYLTVAQRHEIAQELGALLGRVRSLRQSFNSQSKQQTVPLGLLGKDIVATHEKIDAHWRTYTQAEAKPHLDLLGLVSTLPEVQQHAQRLRALETHLLSAQQQKAPRRTQQFVAFHTIIQEFDEMVGSVVNLTPEVKAFLSGVRVGRATLGDLSPEVLAWCREGGRAQAFRIHFGPAN